MITIKPLEEIGQDERGATFVFDTDRSGQLIVGHRKAGTINGRHYHKGAAASKNPEELVLMQGRITLNWRTVETGPSGDHFSADSEVAGGASAGPATSGSLDITGPAQIWIPAYIWHEILAQTDFVMLELNAAADGKMDTYRIDS